MLETLGDVRVVFDNEDAWHGVGCRAAGNAGYIPALSQAECTGGPGVKGVAEAVYGTQKAVGSGRTEFTSEDGEVKLDDVAGRRCLGAPDRMVNRRSGVGPAGVAHEEFQDVEFFTSEVEFLALVGDDTGRGGELEVPDSDDIETHVAKLNGDAGEQLGKGVGLVDVVVRSEVEEFDFHVDIVAGSDDDDADSSVFETDEEVAAFTVGEGEVEENQIGGVLLDLGKPLLDAAGMGGLIAGGLQFFLEDLSGVLVVIDNEDAGHGVSAFRCVGAWLPRVFLLC
jgi:hypothetical protein